MHFLRMAWALHFNFLPHLPYLYSCRGTGLAWRSIAARAQAHMLCLYRATLPAWRTENARLGSAASDRADLFYHAATLFSTSPPTALPAYAFSTTMPLTATTWRGGGGMTRGSDGSLPPWLRCCGYRQASHFSFSTALLIPATTSPHSPTYNRLLPGSLDRLLSAFPIPYL